MIDIATPPYQAHNLKVVGSNPTPATKAGSQKRRLARGGFFCFSANFPQSNQIQMPLRTSAKKPDGRFVLVCVTEKYYKRTYEDATRTQEKDDGT